MANSRSAEQAASDREKVRLLIQANPGITVAAIAQQLGRSKETVYQHVSRLRSEGALQTDAINLPAGQKGKALAYRITKDAGMVLESVNRFDYPSQVTVAAVDGSPDVPKMDEISSLLYGRATESEA